VLAVLDESTPAHPDGLVYVIAGVVLLEDEHAAATAARAVLPAGRTNPFHWHREGPRARRAMIGSLCRMGAVAHVGAEPGVRPKRQEPAREAVLRRLLPRLLHEGADRLLVESRGARLDARDRAVLLDGLNAFGGARAMTYAWHTKADPALWFADAVCGAAADALTGRDATPLAALHDAGVVDRIELGAATADAGSP